MGGVDLTDMLIAVYRIKGKKFFMMFRKVIEMLENVFSWNCQCIELCNDACI